MLGPLQHLGGCVDKKFRSLLHGDSSQEGDHLLLYSRQPFNRLNFRTERFHGIVYGRYLPFGLVVILDNGFAGEVAYTDDVVTVIHTVLLDPVDDRVWLTPAAVVFRSMYVDNQRFSTYVLGMQTGRVGEPVVGVNDVVLISPRNNTGYDGVVVGLLQDIARVPARELQTTKIVGIHVVEVGIYVVTHPEILLWIHELFESRLYRFPADIPPHDGRIVAADYLQKTLIFVAPGLGNNKQYLHIFLLGHSLGQTVTCCSESP